MSKQLKCALLLTVFQLLVELSQPSIIPTSLNRTSYALRDNHTHDNNNPSFDKYKLISDHGQVPSNVGYRTDQQNGSVVIGNDDDRLKAWKQIKEICGYYRMCSETDMYSGYYIMPTCCPRCSCHPSCRISNNCCPDVQIEQPEQVTTGATCMTLYNVLMQSDTEDDLEENNAEQNSQGLFSHKSSEATIDWHSLAGKNITEATSSDIRDHWPEHTEETSTKATSTEDADDRQRHAEETTMKSIEHQVMHSEEASTKPTQDRQDYTEVISIEATENQQNPDNITNVLNKSGNILTADKLYAKYVVVTSCPQDYKDQDVIEKCLRKNSLYTRDHIPVMDMVNIQIYKNVFCAQCHNNFGYISMDIVTNCTRLYLLDSVPVYLKDFREVTRDCLAYIDSSTIVQAESQVCKPGTTDSSIISKCNVTGLWETNNPYTEAMCLKGEHMALHVDRSRTITYKNIYCYLCNARQGTNEQKTCDTNNYIKQKAADEPFETFKAYLSPTLPGNMDRSKIPQGLDRPTATEYLGNRSCMMGYIPDMYSAQCRRFLCPIHEIPIYNICLKKNNKVQGLVVVGKIHVQLANTSTYITGGIQLNVNKVITVIQQQTAAYFQVEKLGCKYWPGEVFTQADGGYLRDFFMMFKIQNTENCSVEMIVDMYSKIANTKVELQPQKIDGNIIPGFSIQMTYQKLLADNFTFKVVPENNLSPNQEVLLNASFYCPRVVLTMSEYEKLVDNGKLDPVENYIIQHEYSHDTGLEICLNNYIKHWLIDTSRLSIIESESRPTVEVTLSAIATVISMLSITVVIITFCLFSELRFIPSKLAMILCINLLLAQAFYAFGLDLGIDNLFCKFMGMCIHFFWLASIFSMNSILFLMLRSLHKPLHVDNRVIIQSRSASEILKYILHCYFLPLVFVLINALSSTLHITEDFGYGGKLCYIRTGKMRLFTFAVPIAIVMFTNFIIFALIMCNLSIFMKTVNEKVHVKQIYIFFKLITITGIYWMFGFLYELTEIRIFSYLFIVLNAGQGFFLMWTFLYNSQVCDLYKNAITKYIKKFKKDSSQSYSLS